MHVEPCYPFLHLETQDFKTWQDTAEQKQIKSMFDGADFLVREKDNTQIHSKYM